MRIPTFGLLACCGCDADHCDLSVRVNASVDLHWTRARRRVAQIRSRSAIGAGRWVSPRRSLRSVWSPCGTCLCSGDGFDLAMPHCADYLRPFATAYTDSARALMSQSTPSRILVIGRTGQLARALASMGDDQRVVETIGREELDITSPAMIDRAIKTKRPDGVINASAYNFVDAAEADPTTAFQVNRDGPAELARRCSEQEIPLVHVSTDYVFGDRADGSHRPFREDGPPNPINQYGLSKLGGEIGVLEAHPLATVLRTCWVYSPGGKNFVTLMLGLAREGRREVRVVNDQVGRPTYAADLAEACLVTLGQLMSGDHRYSGRIHYCGEEDTSRAAFAKAIFEGALERGLPAAKVVEISAAEFAATAARPAYSALSIARAMGLEKLSTPPWRRRLEACLDRIVSDC